MAADLAPQEEQITKQFLEEVNLQRRQSNQSPISWKDAIKFCMARKFDKERAIELLRSYEETRMRERLLNINPCNDEVKKELLSGKLTILKERDASGAAIAMFTARFHNPLTSARNITLQSLVHQLDAALDSLDTQRNGLVFVYDMTDSKFSNFDYDLCVKILDLLKGSFPARLKKVLIVLAPLWFKAPFKILRLFVREKLRDRVYTVDDSDIIRHIPTVSLPTHLGGTQKVDHIAWLRECLKSHRLPDPAIHAFFDGVKHPNYMTSKFAAHAQQIDALSRSSGSYPSSVVSPAHRGFPQPSVNQQRDSNNHHQPHHNLAADHERRESNNPTFNSQHRGGGGDSTAPTVPPPPVPTRHSQPDVVDPKPPQIPWLGPSWEDVDPRESVFPGSVRELMDAKDHLERSVEMGKSGLVSEYMRIKNEPHQDSFVNARNPANSTKNRYSDVLCYDYTRVTLKHNERNPAFDYINANHVNSFNQKRGYICCQGPLPKTFVDFWRMIWQEKVRTIVMTTKLVEKGRTKCGTYWPQEINSMETYGDINVMNMEMVVDSSEDYQISTLCICHKTTGETRFLKHMLFLRWPDYGIPPSADSFLHFVLKVREVQAKTVKEMPEWKGHPRGPPIVVHCSAGIGRTGTFICSDICMYLLDNVGKINIKSVVRLIRTQRAFAIQMPDQYVFCHIAILQYAQKQGHLPPDIDVPTLLEDDF